MLPLQAIPVDVTTSGQYLTFPSIAGSAPDSLPLSTSDEGPPSFQQYLEQLPHWDWELVVYEAVHCADSTTADLIQQLTDPQQELILGSDGGARDPIGSFGAAIATPSPTATTTGAILVEMGGIAFGLATSSFRAESYRQLAPLR
eukprot:scaffold3908_cov99-Cylindrotheca_fusiformis.AAC.1